MLGAWSQFGAAGAGKDTTVTVVYFAVLLLTALGVGPALRRIWRGGDGSDAAAETDQLAGAGDAGGGSAATSGSADDVNEVSVRSKKVIV